MANRLPRGWEQLEHPSGRIFFVDHIRKKCSWIDPRDNQNRPRKPNELPYGWTLEWDPECGEYLCDHISKKVTKRNPRSGLILPFPEVDANGKSITSRPTSKFSSEDLDYSAPPRHRSASASLASNSTKSSMNETDWKSAGDKLREVKQRFEENHLVLFHLRKEVASATERSGITEDMLQPLSARTQTPADEENKQVLQNKRESIFRSYKSVEPALLQEITRAFETQKLLKMEDHIEQLHQFINDQYNEVEALRKLQTVLISDGRSAEDKLSRLDRFTYEALFQLFAHEDNYIAAHQEKLAYFNRLLEYTDYAAAFSGRA